MNGNELQAVMVEDLKSDTPTVIPADFNPYAIKRATLPEEPSKELFTTFDAVGREFKDGVQISGPPPGPYRYSPWQLAKYPLYAMRGKHPNSGLGKHKGWQRARRSPAIQEALQSCAFEKREQQKKKRLALDILQNQHAPAEILRAKVKTYLTKYPE